MRFNLKQKLSPAHLKHFTATSPIKVMPAAPEMVFALFQHAGKPALPAVAVGARVKVGTPIARPDGFISSAVHSSVSGEVKAIENRPHPALGESPAIVITSDGQDTPDDNIQPRQDIDNLSSAQIIEIVQKSGIVGLGGAGFPTHVKLSPPKDKPVDTLILNGAECEPYLTADHRLMVEQANQIFSGMKIAMKALKATKAVIAIEENKPDAIAIFKKLADGKNIRLISIKSFYPQGAEKQLIQAALQREVPSGCLPFDVGVVVQNVATCFAIYQAVYQGKPLYERVVTVTGTILKNPANLLIKLGTSLRSVIDFCGGATEEIAKVIIGGPMMGIAQCSLDVAVIKGTSGIIVFSKKQAAARLRQPCIRCGQCLRVCPMGLNPSAIARAIEMNRLDLAQEYYVLDCVECGICSYTCPGNSDIVGLVKLAKQKLKNKK